MPWLRSFAALLLLAPALLAADWPQWLGPHRDGASSEKVVPWQGPLKVVWRQPVGEGHSSPVVADGRVYLHVKTAKPGIPDAEALRAFDATTGKPLWSSAYPRAPYKGLFGSGPRATPAVVAGKVYTYGITGILTCFDAKKGEKLWQVDALKEFHAPNLYFGASCSPLVEKNLVLINVGGKGASIVAFNKDNGKVVWRKLSDGASYSSPTVFGKGQKREVVFLTKDNLVGLHPANGEVFWEFPFKDKLSESSTTPVRAGDLLIGSSITAGSVALRLKMEGQMPEVSKVWKKPELTCYFATPVVVGKDYLYMVTGSLLAQTATLHCVEVATGKSLWQRPNVGKFHASLLRTGNGKVLMLEEKGDLVLIDPSPKEYRELARTHICGKTWAHPALANGRLYVRDEKELICLEMPH